MEYNSFLILPTQLFEVKYLPKYTSKCKIFIWECPWYFNNPKYNYNKKKLLLHRASMKHYYDYLKLNKFNVYYLEFNEIFDLINYSMFDPIDSLKLLKLTPSNVEKSPNFLLTKSNYQTYRDKTQKFFFNSFYMFGKSIINVIPDIKSKDKENRQVPKSQIKINKPPLAKIDKLYIKEASVYVEKHFKNNIGNINDFMFPVTHSTSKKWLDFFIKEKFSKFGDYQDYIDKSNEFNYHSLLSTSINIGLLNPPDLIDTVCKYKKIIPINSFEGYIRQLFWREYQRYTYIYFYSINKNRKLNFFGNRRRLTKKWYNGTLGVIPLDNAIISGISTGYLHHISRLMVVGNFMNLYGISPQQGFKWFMEFSCDSYDWVMCQNIYGMAFFSDGGKTMRRPYLSSSNYILKMSNYKKDKWSDIWDKMYKDFLKKNKTSLLKYRYYYKV